MRGIGLGLASGILSTSATATVLFRSSPKDLPPAAASPWIRGAAMAGAIGEVIANAAISSLPARTQPGPIGGRILMGSLAGALLPADSTCTRLTTALAGGIAAPLSAWCATTSRAAVVPPVPDLVVATLETVAAYGLAVAATRRQ